MLEPQASYETAYAHGVAGDVQPLLVALCRAIALSTTPAEPAAAPARMRAASRSGPAGELAELLLRLAVVARGGGAGPPASQALAAWRGPQPMRLTTPIAIVSGG